MWLVKMFARISQKKKLLFVSALVINMHLVAADDMKLTDIPAFRILLTIIIKAKQNALDASVIHYDSEDEKVSEQTYTLMAEQKVSWVEYLLRRLGSPLFLNYILFSKKVATWWQAFVKKVRSQICI